MSSNNVYCGFSTGDVYQGVINDVVSGVKEAFVDDDVELEILYQIKADWIAKIEASGCVPKKNIKPNNIPPPVRMASTQLARVPNVIQTQPAFVRNGVHFIPVRIEQQQEENVLLMQAPLYVPSSPHTRGIQYAEDTMDSQEFKSNAHSQEITPTNNSTQPPEKIKLTVHQQETKPSIAHSSMYQLDGHGAGMSDSSSDEEDFDPLRTLAERVGNGFITGEDEDKGLQEAEPPLNSDDDEDEEPLDQLLNAENVIICQYEKINRTRTKWKLNLKDGIMHINKKDHCFHRANGEATF